MPRVRKLSDSSSDSSEEEAINFKRGKRVKKEDEVDNKKIVTRATAAATRASPAVAISKKANKGQGQQSTIISLKKGKGGDSCQVSTCENNGPGGEGGGGGTSSSIGTVIAGRELRRRTIPVTDVLSCSGNSSNVELPSQPIQDPKPVVDRAAARPPAMLGNVRDAASLQKFTIGPLNRRISDPDLTSQEAMDAMGLVKGVNCVEQPAKNNLSFDMQTFSNDVVRLNISLDGIGVPKFEDALLEEDREITYISSHNELTLSLADLLAARRLGPPIKCVEIDKNNAFIDPLVFKQLTNCREIFYPISRRVYRFARSDSNLFEEINEGPFICRSAMKVANYEYLLNKELTDPKYPDGRPVLGPNDLFYFADICAGPGGFSEYILWKKGWGAKGFGFTLKTESLDFKLKNFASWTETFEPFYGVAGDGNIYNNDNVRAFIQHVLRSSDNKGVHLVLADGGFDTMEGRNLQEVLSYQIILSQIFVALSITRVGGHFICKLFDVITPFSVALLYFLYMSFENIAVHKPVTSRPANAEKYVICKWKKSNSCVNTIIKYLADCHSTLWELGKSGRKEIIHELVPISLLTNLQDPFYDYVKSINAGNARKQILALKQIIFRLRDCPPQILKEQKAARSTAMQLWGIPEKIPPKGLTLCRQPDEVCTELLKGKALSVLQTKNRVLLIENVESIIKSPYDWRFVPVGNYATRGYYLSLGQSKVFRFNEGISKWNELSDEQMLELPQKTLIYGEFVDEVYDDAGLERRETFHIIDGLIVGGLDIRNFHFTQRLEACEKLAKAVSKRNRLIVRVKSAVRLEHLHGFLINMVKDTPMNIANVGGSNFMVPLGEEGSERPFMLTEGIVCLKITQEPWQMALNKIQKVKYFFNTSTKEESAMIVEAAVAGFFSTMDQRAFWTWGAEDILFLKYTGQRDPKISPERLHVSHFLNYITYGIDGSHKNSWNAASLDTEQKEHRILDDLLRMQVKKIECHLRQQQKNLRNA